MTILEMLEETVGYDAHYNAIDIEVAHKALCKCGRKMKYRGFKKNNSYRAFCVCEKCNVAEEF